MKSTHKSSKRGSLISLNTTGSLKKTNTLKGTKKNGMSQEKQGPTDWSSRGLKAKYRGEKQREDAWQLWMSAFSDAQRAIAEDNTIIPTVKVERHPFYRTYYNRLGLENGNSSTRTKARLMMKRFVFDVQEIWLTNLEHLREHHHSHLFMSTGDEAKDLEHLEKQQQLADEAAAKALQDERENVCRGNGLNNRRDVRAIEAMDSQIQSVSEKRAFARAYHTARLPSIQVVLDYKPERAPQLSNIKCIPPTIETLIRGVRISPSVTYDGGGATPPSPTPGGTTTTTTTTAAAASAEVLPHLHSRDKYPLLVYVLHIDRLLPSPDYQSEAAVQQQEVLWRFSLFRNDDSAATQVFVATEASVADYVASLIMRKNAPEPLLPGQQGGPAAVAALSSYVLCSGGVFHSGPNPIPLPCHFRESRSGGGGGGGEQVTAVAAMLANTASSTEALVTISAAVLGFSRDYSGDSSAVTAIQQEDGSPAVSDATPYAYFDCYEQPAVLQQHILAHHIHSIKVEICVEILRITTSAGSSEGSEALQEKLFLECSPAELRFLLRMPDASLGDITWWLSTDREQDVWCKLAQHLIIEGGGGGAGEGAGSYNLAFTSTIEERQERNSQGGGLAKIQPEHVPGALSTLEALSCAYELLDAIRLQPNPSPAPGTTTATANTTTSATSGDHEGGAGVENSGEQKQEEEDAAATSSSSAKNQTRIPYVLHLDGTNVSSFFSHVDYHRRSVYREADYAGEQQEEEEEEEEDGGDRKNIAGDLHHGAGDDPLVVFYDNQQRVDNAPASLNKPTSSSSSSSNVNNSSNSSKGSKKAVGKKKGKKGGPKHDADYESPDPKFARIIPAVNVMAPLPPQTKQHIVHGHWEVVEDTNLNSSIIASGAIHSRAQVPGAIEHGRVGMWFADQNTDPLFAAVERTQAAARFLRETRATSSHSILVNMTYALDTALRFSTLLAWEAFSAYPAPTPAEEVDGVVPPLSVSPLELLGQVLKSPIEDRLSSTVMIFASLPVEGVDFMPRDTPSLPKGYRRHVPIQNEWGYREQIEVTLLGVDPVVSTVVFGVTKTGAVTNNTGVNNRNLWHNSLAITEAINRPRAPKDYHYILVKGEHQGTNEPTRYTTRMEGDKMRGLTSSAFAEFEDKYDAIQQLRDIFNKQVALDAKIEKVETDMKLRDKMLKIHMQGQVQRAIEKKMRKATKSEVGWRMRFKASTIIEIQGNWERRRDDRTGMYFFRNLAPEVSHQPPVEDQGAYGGERFLNTCQWEVPAQWDGDPLAPEPAGGKLMAQSSYPAGGFGGQLRGANASFGSLSASHDGVSDMQEGELDGYDMAPGRWDPQPSQFPPLQLPSNKGPFEQPADDWMPQNSAFGSITGSGLNSKIGAPTAVANRTGGGNVRHGRPPLPTGATNTTAASTSKAGGFLQRPNSRGADSVASDMDSAAADKSLAESVAPTIDTANLEHIAEQLVSSDELMRVIARRLGLPESQVIPADELSSVFSVSSVGSAGSATAAKVAKDTNQDPLHAPRDDWADELDEPEFDSDDDLWSDDEHEVGDFDEEKEIGAREDMPENQWEAAQLRRKELRAMRKQKLSGEVKSVPENVPTLDLGLVDGSTDPNRKKKKTAGDDEEEEETREQVFGWRRLPRPVIRPGFLSDALLTHTKPPDALSSNTLNNPIFLMPISPVDACKYVPEQFTTAIESIFVPDCKKDMERSVATVERNIRREEELSRNLPSDDLLLFGEANEFTSTDAYLARQLKDDQDQVRDPAEEAATKAVLAAKSTNIAMMEDALAEEISVNTADEYGNTLLILAAQQGSKRMCKFLLRRGANINMQNLVGNTPLHYCYAYSNNNLGVYMKNKGADDSIVNVDGLTCYEGLSRESMNEMYGDDEEAHMADGDDDDDDDDDF